MQGHLRASSGHSRASWLRASGSAHLGKSRGGGHALNAGIGSIDFVAAARSVLLVGADPDEPNKRAVVQIKNNLAPHGEAIGYTLEDGQFYWTGASTLTANRILSLATDDVERSA